MDLGRDCGGARFDLARSAMIAGPSSTCSFRVPRRPCLAFYGLAYEARVSSACPGHRPIGHGLRAQGSCASLLWGDSDSQPTISLEGKTRHDADQLLNRRRVHLISGFRGVYGYAGNGWRSGLQWRGYSSPSGRERTLETHSDCIVHISDNASTDGTAEVGEALAVEHDRVLFTRQHASLGAVGNFRFVLQQARLNILCGWLPTTTSCPHTSNALSPLSRLTQL